MKGLVSIVIPVYNHLKELNDALASIDKQTYKNVEIIVVDSGSDEKLLESKKYKLIRKENKGAPSARNSGLDVAKGEYIIFWDADIVAESTFLEKLTNVLEKNREASFAYTNMSFGKRKMPAQEFDVDLLKKRNYIHSTSLIRRVDAIRWDESLKRFQDWDLWLTMSEKGNVGIWIDEYLFVAQTRKGSISNWLPSFAYKKPWKWLPWFSGRVKLYEKAKNILFNKHGL